MMSFAKSVSSGNPLTSSSVIVEQAISFSTTAPSIVYAVLSTDGISSQNISVEGSNKIEILLANNTNKSDDNNFNSTNVLSAKTGNSYLTILCLTVFTIILAFITVLGVFFRSKLGCRKVSVPVAQNHLRGSYYITKENDPRGQFEMVNIGVLNFSGSECVNTDDNEVCHDSFSDDDSTEPDEMEEIDLNT